MLQNVLWRPCALRSRNSQYLAYHEGRGDYSRGSHLSKPWLIQVARKVEQQSRNYQAQLKQCSQKLEDDRSWFF